jgi:hypothetical protein
MATGGAPTTDCRSWRVDLLLVLALLALTAPFLREWSTQPASRYLFTAAVVDDHSFQVDPYRDALGLDYAEVNGHFYSDKAPYQPLLAAPAYWLYRAAGGDPVPRGVTGSELLHRLDAGLWLMTLVSAILPACGLIVLMRRHVARHLPRQAVPATLALMFGTVLLPFSSLLFGHVLAAFVGFAAWFLLRRRERPAAGALLAAGVLLGAGIGVEYPQVVLAGVLGIYSIVAFKARAVWVAIGGALGVIPLLLLNITIFGGPFKTAYSGYQPNFQGNGAFGVYNLVAPKPDQLVLALFGDRGLLTLTPIMILAIVGCVLAVRARSRARADGIIALVLLVLYLLVSTGIDGYGGSVPGPRYLTPILPFFVLPLAGAWKRWPGPATLLAIWSSIWMILATLTDPLYSSGGAAAVDWLEDLFRGPIEHSIPGAVFGRFAVLVAPVLAVVAAVAAIRLDRRYGATPSDVSRTRSEPAPPTTPTPPTPLKLG